MHVCGGDIVHVYSTIKYLKASDVYITAQEHVAEWISYWTKDQNVWFDSQC